MQPEGIFQPGAEQLSLERVRTNVLVVQRRGIHDATDDDCRAANSVIGIGGLFQKRLHRLFRDIGHNLPQLAQDNRRFSFRKPQRNVVRLL